MDGREVVRHGWEGRAAGCAGAGPTATQGRGETKDGREGVHDGWEEVPTRSEHRQALLGANKAHMQNINSEWHEIGVAFR